MPNKNERGGDGVDADESPEVRKISDALKNFADSFSEEDKGQMQKALGLAEITAVYNESDEDTKAIINEALDVSRRFFGKFIFKKIEKDDIKELKAELEGEDSPIRKIKDKGERIKVAKALSVMIKKRIEEHKRLDALDDEAQ